MTKTQVLSAEVRVEQAPPIVHYAAFDHPGRAMCGAEVIGIRTRGQLSCVVCAEMWDGKGRQHD